MQEYIIEIENGIARMPAYRLAEPLNIKIKRCVPVAVFGNNASGKSLFVSMLTGEHPLLSVGSKYISHFPEKESRNCNIKVVTFCDAYGYGNEGFYQLRWNHGLLLDSLTVEQSLRRHSQSGDLPEEVISLLGLESLLDKQLIMLSSGELRRMQFAEALIDDPALLVIDNPYIGLDAETREQTTELLKKISLSSDLTLMIVVSRVKDIPEFIDTVIPVSEKKVMSATDRKSILSTPDKYLGSVIPEDTRSDILALPEGNENKGDIIECNDVRVAYGTRTILNHFSWNVKYGEHWAVNGVNGSGKSTLLSLICADNPQAYSQDISLFGYKRGNGESIWDIKRHIGYVSPELYRAYKKSVDSWKIVASGLNDTGIIKSDVDEKKRNAVDFWLKVFGIENLANRNYLQLSSGEQRLILLARAFVKDPKLLILDEPFHGLDEYNLQRAREIIDAFCSRKDKTLIMVSHYKEEYPEAIDHELTLKKNS